MKNPIPYLIAALALVAAAFIVSPTAHAQVLGWVMVGEDTETQDFVVLDSYVSEDDCLAAREDFINYLARQGKRLPASVHLYCTPVRPS